MHLAVGGTLTASGSLLYAGTAEPRRFDVTRTRIALAGLAGEVKALHLADLHSSSTVPTPLLEQAVRAGLREAPDVVFLTGDYISTLRAFDEAGLRRIFRRLADAAPVYAVMGNHDASGSLRRDPWANSYAMRSILRASGVRVLLNESATLTVRDATLGLVGTGDLWTRAEFDPEAAFQEAPEGLPTLLLAHNPDSKEPTEAYRWDLMLSGHTHGGQVVLPMVHPYWLPVRDQRFIAGLYEWNGRQIYITRGVGSPSGIRFRCRPEVSILQLVPAEGPAFQGRDAI